jgi:hypothetical protein
VAKIQFILKKREAYYSGENEYSSGYNVLHSGLFNSASFVCDMLKDMGYETEIVHVIDNNCIDREVTRFKPDIVVIEAFWCVPEKFDILSKLHPNVKWIIRNHSRLPFLANEGIAMDWTLKYAAYQNVFVSSNALDTNEEIRVLIKNAYPNISDEELAIKCPYLPNYYPLNEKFKKVDRCDRKNKADVIDVGCFGAVRPLKNHLIQATAAIKFANSVGKKLRFHINATRIENKGDEVLKNLKALFSHLEHELVEHEWAPHDQFLDMLEDIDIGLQVSYSETFNIVAADLVARCVPIVTSDQIEWVSSFFHADPNNSDDIAAKMERAWLYGFVTPRYCTNRAKLNKSNKLAKKEWLFEITRLLSLN